MLNKIDLELFKIADSVIDKELTYWCIIEIDNYWSLIYEMVAGGNLYIEEVDWVLWTSHIGIERELLEDFFPSYRIIWHFPTSKQLIDLVFEKGYYNAIDSDGVFIQINHIKSDIIIGSWYQLPKWEPITWTDKQKEELRDFLLSLNS